MDPELDKPTSKSLMNGMQGIGFVFIVVAVVLAIGFVNVVLLH